MPDSIWRHLHETAGDFDDDDGDGLDWRDDLPRPVDVDRLMAEPDDNEPLIASQWDEEPND